MKITKIAALCLWMILGLLFTTTSIAQVKFGVRAGILISNQEFKQGQITVEPKSKFGLDLAVVSDIPLGNVISFGPELHWLQKGFKIEDLDINGFTISGTSTLNYLELPLLVKFNFGETAKFFVMGGPSFGYLLGHKTEDEDGNEIDLGDLHDIELGAHFGAGVGVGPLVVDIRYILGLTNLAKDLEDAEVHNTAFGAGVSLMF